MTHRPHSLLLTPLLLAILALAACGDKFPSYEEMKEINRKELAPVLEKHRAAATAKLDAIAACGKEAKAAAPVTARQPLPEKVAIPDGTYEIVKAGVLLVNADWADFEGQDETPVRFDSILPAGTLASALKTGDLPDSGHSVQSLDEEFAKLTDLRQIALIRVHRYTPPKSALIDGQRRFTGGTAIGDVQLYDLESRKRIGAFPFEIGQSDEASISAKEEAAIERELAQSFTSGYGYDIRRELTAFGNGEEGPAAPGAAEKASLKRFADKIRWGIVEHHGFAFPKRVDLEQSPNGITITIHAGDPKYLTNKQGVVHPEVIALVEKVLGTKAEVKVVKAPEEKTPEK